MAELLNKNNKPVKSIVCLWVRVPEIGKTTTFSMNNGQTFETSRVEAVNIINRKKGWVCFETKNTIYHCQGTLV